MPELTQHQLATPTLVRLYLQQGHYDRARDLLHALVERHPLHGEALALLARIDRCQGHTLKSRLVRGKLTLRWDIRSVTPVLRNDGFFLRIHFFTRSADNAIQNELRKIACQETAGKLTLPIPSGPGACASCLVHEDPSQPEDSRPRMLAVGKVHRWR